MDWRIWVQRWNQLSRHKNEKGMIEAPKCFMDREETVVQQF